MAYELLRIKEETSRCLLCEDAPCSKECKKQVDIASVIRSIRFENPSSAVKKAELLDCSNCDEPCSRACNLVKIGQKIDIPGIIRDLKSVVPLEKESDIDLSIDFCKVRCENPFFLSSSVVGSNYEMVAKAFDLGWAGVAFKTIGLFQPHEVSPRFASLAKESNPMIGFKNIEQISEHTLEENINYLKQLKKDYPTKVIIASIMGRTKEEWTILAQKMEQAGADIIECNFSCPQMVGEGLGSDVGTNLLLVEEYTRAVRQGTKLPILAKMTPNITDMTKPAMAAVNAGADGLAAINTIKSIMNIDLNSFVSQPTVEFKSSIGGYSGKAVKPIALRFISDLKKTKELKEIPISGMGGIETWRDAAEFLALGCETVQVTTAVMQYGYRIIEDLVSGLKHYLTQKKMSSVKELIGRAINQITVPEDLNRHSIEYPKFDRSLCISCQRCYLSCYDGGHQAIYMDTTSNYPVLNAKKCVGCQLCRVVCPSGAIKPGKRIEKSMIQNKN